jgi:hypothetical protein
MGLVLEYALNHENKAGIIDDFQTLIGWEGLSFLAQF